MMVSEQLRVMLTMIAAGSGIGFQLFLLDRYFPKRGLFELLFWVLQGAGVFFLLFQVNGGTFRVYIFVSLLCGYALFQSIGRPAAEKLVRLLERTLRLIAGIISVLILTPLLAIFKGLMFFGTVLFSCARRILSWILRLAMRPFVPVWSFLLKIREFFAKKVKSWLNLLYNREE